MAWRRACVPVQILTVSGLPGSAAAGSAAKPASSSSSTICAVGKAKARVRMAGAQLLAVVRGEIDHRDPAPGARHPRRLGQRGLGLLRIMQHLMEQHRVKAGIGERQRGEIALHEIEPVGGKLLQAASRDAQHLGALVERGDVAGALREQFGDAAGAGADIEQRTDALARQRTCQRRLDRLVGRVERAQRVPFVGMAREIGFGGRFTRRTDRRQMAPVPCTALREALVLGLSRGDELRCERAHRWVRCAAREGPARADRALEEHPAAFLAPLGEPGIAEDADVARDPRLALPQHLREFAHRQLHVRQQAHDAQPCRVGKRAQERVDLHFDGGYKDIFICVQG